MRLASPSPDRETIVSRHGDDRLPTGRRVSRQIVSNEVLFSLPPLRRAGGCRARGSGLARGEAVQTERAPILREKSAAFHPPGKELGEKDVRGARVSVAHLERHLWHLLPLALLGCYYRFTRFLQTSAPF